MSNLFTRRLALAAFSLIGATWLAPQASADLLHVENFNSTSTGSMPAGWSISSLLTGSGPSANRDGDVRVVTKSGSDRNLRMTDDSSVESRSAIWSFPRMDNAVTIYWNMMLPQSSMWAGANIAGRLGNNMVRISLTSSGDIMAYDGTTNTDVGNYSSGSWYTLRAVLDLNNQTYDFYVGSTQVANDFDFYEAGTSASSIRFWTSTAQTGTANVDYLRIYGEPGDVYSPSYSYGAPNSHGGQPVGGGNSSTSYTGGPTSGMADYTVSSASALTSALSSASSGDIVWVSNGSSFNVTIQKVIPAGVTLASGRGRGSNGALIYSSKTTNGWRMILANEGSRIVGLRLRGPNGTTSATETAAIKSNHANIEVDGCYIYNWGFAGIHMTAAVGATKYDNYIHHNLFRNIQKSGLGYPVEFGPRAAGIVRANDMSSFRHAIAHWGDPGDHYTFSHNKVGSGTSFAVDMHTMHEQGGRPSLSSDSGNEYHLAGDHINVFRNTFTDSNDRAIKVRGMPDMGAYIYDNNFQNLSNTINAIAVDNSEGNMFIERNQFSGTVKTGQNYRRD